MYENLEDFGKDCAVDGKYLDSYGNRFYKNKANDGRGEHEATNSCKTYYMKDGTTKNEWHYGYRAHIICDAKYGLPIKSRVTPANNSEQTELDNMMEEMAKGEEKYKLEKMENLMGDTGYDNGDRDYMFNDHFIRGKEKMELIVDLSFLVMLTMAKGRIKNKQKNIRSLIA